MNGSSAHTTTERRTAIPPIGIQQLEYIGTPVGELPSPPDEGLANDATWRAAATVCNQDCYTTCTVNPDFCCF